MKPILFATDGSPSAAAAQAEAFELARLMEAPLVVVSVVHPVLPTVGYTAYGYSNLVGELAEAERQRVDDVLDRVGAEAKAAGLECTTISVSGPVVEGIVDVARERAPRMIVVGSHGWGLGGRVVHGSVSTAILHAAPCPVLVVRGPEPTAHRAKAA